MADNDMFTTAYHIEQGPMFMYRTDAIVACGQFPNEWALTAWSDEAIKAYAAQKAGPDPVVVDPVPAPVGKASKGG